MNKRISQYKEASRELWSRAFANKEKGAPKKGAHQKKEVDEDVFKNELEEVVQDFETSDEQEIHFSRRTFTDAQFETVCNVAKDFNMKLTLSHLHEDVLTLSKGEVKLD